MKKLILSLAMLVGSSSVLPLVASAESMYQDIMGSIVNASLVKNDQERFFALRSAFHDVERLKISAEQDLIQSYGEGYLKKQERFLGVVFAACSTLVLLVPNPSRTIFEHLVVAGLCGSFAIGFFAQQQINRYFLKKKLVELNEVIAKLEAAKAELQNKAAIEQQDKMIAKLEAIQAELENKIATEQQEQDATPVEQQA